MNLSKKSWHYSLYKMSFDYYNRNFETQNFCNYFWKLVFAFITFPILIPFHLLSFILRSFDVKFDQEWNEDDNTYYSTVPFLLKLITSLTFFAAGLFIYIILMKLSKLDVGTLLQAAIWFSLTILVGILAIRHKSPITYLTEKTVNEIQEVNTIVKTAFVSFKEKHCPRINWK